VQLLEVELPDVVPPLQLVLWIRLGVLEVRGAGLLVDAAEHDEALEPLDRPALLDEARG
jgi:hypothetical protein